MSVYDVFCDPCGAVRPHAAGDGLIVCTGCGLVREVDVRQLAAVMAYAELLPVQDTRYCDWCRQTREVGHDCPAGAVGCTTNPPDGPTCGTCGACVAAMTADLRRREHPFADDPYGSPSDLPEASA